jgi:hypothetical protein
MTIIRPIELFLERLAHGSSITSTTSCGQLPVKTKAEWGKEIPNGFNAGATFSL